MSLQDRQLGIGRLRLGAAIVSALAVLLMGALAAPASAYYAYVANGESASVSVIETKSGQAVGPPIQVGAYPSDIAITPDGRRAFVTVASGGVWAIDTATDQVARPAIPITGAPIQIAITPDGGTAYVANAFSANVSVLDLQLSQVLVDSPISVESEPEGIVISPDGKTAYILRGTAGRTGLTVFDIWTNRVVASIPLGIEPTDLAIAPDGRTVYVTEASLESSSNGVLRIDTETNEVVGRIPMAEPPSSGGPRAIAISPGGRWAYVLGPDSSVQVIDTDANEVVGSPIPVEAGVTDIAIAPDGQTAYLTNYFSNSVSVVDTRTNRVVGDQIPVGTAPSAIAIAEDLPSVRVGCPESGPDSCRLSIQAMTRRRKGRAQSTVTNAKLRSKRPRLVPLKPRRRFAGRIARAGRLLVKETVEIHGVRQTTYRRLKVFRSSHRKG